GSGRAVIGAGMGIAMAGRPGAMSCASTATGDPDIGSIVTTAGSGSREPGSSDAAPAAFFAGAARQARSRIVPTVASSIRPWRSRDDREDDLTADGINSVLIISQHRDSALSYDVRHRPSATAAVRRADRLPDGAGDFRPGLSRRRAACALRGL